MNENTVASSKLLVELLSGDGLNEAIAILIVIAIAIISGRIAKTVLVRIGSNVMVRPWTGRLIETAVILTPYLVAALLIGLAENAARQFGMAYNVLALTSQLVVALGVVRIAVYCLRLLLGDTSLVARWETRITLVLWLGLGFELLGWFNWLENTLDAIDLLPGKSVFSLWALLKGLIVITAFVVITSVIARAIERRVMSLETLAPSTRVGISKFTYFLLISLGILLGINAAGVDLTALTVLTGAIVFGLGFGIRDITANFVSGFVLLMDKSIKPGDVISFTQHTGTTSENFGWVQALRGQGFGVVAAQRCLDHAQVGQKGFGAGVRVLRGHSVACCISVREFFQGGSQAGVQACESPSIGLVLAVFVVIGRALSQCQHLGAKGHQHGRERQLAAQVMQLGQVVAQHHFALAAQGVFQGLCAHIGVAVAVAADP